MIKVVNLKKSFDNIKVISDISFEINKGEIVTFLGPSGSGKTTLLNCLTGLDNQFEGDIEINGLMQNKFLKEDRMALVTQKYGNYPWMTVEENIKLGLDEKENFGKVNDIIDKIELKGFENYFSNQLSGGMQQRVALGRAILQNSDILVMDEPFGALDYMTRANLQKMLKEINNKYRKTIVFVTHDIEEAIYLSDRIFILSKTPTVIAKEIVLPPTISQMNTSEIKYKEVFIKVRSEIENVLSSLEGFKSIENIFSTKNYTLLKNVNYWNTFLINECRNHYENLSKNEQVDLSLSLLGSENKNEVVIGTLLHKDIPQTELKNKLKEMLRLFEHDNFEMIYFLTHSLTNLKSSLEEKKYYRKLILSNLDHYLKLEKKYFTVDGLLDEAVVLKIIKSRFSGDSTVNLENKGWLILISSLADPNKKAVLNFLDEYIINGEAVNYNVSDFDKQTAKQLIKNLQDE